MLRNRSIKPPGETNIAIGRNTTSTTTTIMMATTTVAITMKIDTVVAATALWYAPNVHRKVKPLHLNTYSQRMGAADLTNMSHHRAQILSTK